MKHAPAFNKEIALLEINGTMTILRTKQDQGQADRRGPPARTGRTAQDLLEKFAKLKAQPDVNVYYTNTICRSAVQEVASSRRPSRALSRRGKAVRART